ncbi:MAG: hypothetical protein HN353_11280 [Bdellovibrionales bacterium]|jgi:hypothetical protein|nr:hypothetical protein [Bdellovibrionales bacterium]MBT3525148.1 hypothetical protein [Bdellovibrionales bacterium]MBT7669231.1 hypothetical protein [Bdellovibrionales bacterium]MBT7767985.1 hypothetical protein [Bdellovibrionales bacterium]
MMSKMKWITSKSLITGRTRRRLIVSPIFQYTFMAHILAIVLLSFAIIFCANYYFFQTYIERGISLQLPPSHVFYDLLNEQQEFMNHVLLIATLTLSSIFTIWGLIFSRRVAGPCHKIQTFFESKNMEKGQEDKQESSIIIRRNDFFSEMAKEINYFLADKKGCSCDDSCKCRSESKSNHLS